MPGSAVRTHAAWNTRAPLTSTVQTRQTPIGVCSCAWQSTGMSMPTLRAASSTVLPEGTRMGLPSIVSSMVPIVWVTLIARSPGHRAHVGRTLPVDDVGLDLVGEMLDDRRDRRRSDLAQPADRRLAHSVGKLGDEVEVLTAPAARRDAHEELRQLDGPQPARHALAARFVPVEPDRVEGHVEHARALGADHERAGAQHRAD